MDAKLLEPLRSTARQPLFDKPLHVGAPNVVDRERFLARVNDLLDRNWLTNHGPYVRELEQRLAERMGVEHCVALSNGTAALEIAIRAADLAGEVIVPSFTFVATAHALQWLGITPVFCDIDPRTHNIDPGRVEELITARTTGIIGVHLWGRPCSVGELEEIAARHRLKLLFDAAHGFDCSLDGAMVGTFGNAEVFSFHATKVFNTLEGGAVATNDEELATKVRLMSNFGFAGLDAVVTVGTNGKMNEVAAAMGLTMLEDLDEVIAVNRRNYRLYKEHLSGIHGIELVTYDESERCNFHYVVLEIDERAAAISRDELLARLWSENIRGRRYFYPGCHRAEPYRSLMPEVGRRLSQTEQLGERVLALPTGTAVEPDDVHKICDFIRGEVLGGWHSPQRDHGREIVPL